MYQAPWAWSPHHLLQYPTQTLVPGRAAMGETSKASSAWLERAPPPICTFSSLVIDHPAIIPGSWVKSRLSCDDLLLTLAWALPSPSGGEEITGREEEKGHRDAPQVSCSGRVRVGPATDTPTQLDGEAGLQQTPPWPARSRHPSLWSWGARPCPVWTRRLISLSWLPPEAHLHSAAGSWAREPTRGNHPGHPTGLSPESPRHFLRPRPDGTTSCARPQRSTAAA